MSRDNVSSRFHRWLLPGFVFQSVLVGGGYATGRELVEFFVANGPVAALVGMVVATTIFSVAMMIAFEIARVFRVYDYRLFTKLLLGRAWVLFEISFIALLILVISVLGAASGEILHTSLSVPKLIGTALFVAAVVLLVFRGTALIEKVFAGWALLLYGGYLVLLVWSLWRFGGAIDDAFINYPTVATGGLWSAVQYTGYSIAIVPVILFVARHFHGRRDALVAGLLAGPLGMLPAFCFLFAMLPFYPEITRLPVPVMYIIDRLDARWFSVVLYIIIFGTLIQTATALVHAVNERVAENLLEMSRQMPRVGRPLVALGVMLLGLILADRYGLVALIGKGYGYSAYVFLGLVTAPLLTRGLLLAWRRAEHHDSTRTRVS